MIHSYVFSAIMKAIVSDAASENERGQIARNTLIPAAADANLVPRIAIVTGTEAQYLAVTGAPQVRTAATRGPSGVSTC